MPSISGIVLTKNSERTIGPCIKALLPAVDYVTVVDTGSTDNTIQIAKDSGARVYHFEWCDDFAAARNFGDSLSNTDWVIHVDSDEILRSEDTHQLRRMCAMHKKTTEPVVIGIRVINVTSGGEETELTFRMYKRGVLVWRGIIHEQIYAKRGEPFFGVPSDIGVIHDGYNPDILDMHEKVLTRNIRLLHKGIEQEPDNASYHHFLGRDYMSIGQYQAAIPHLRISLDLLEQQKMLYKLEYGHQLLMQCLESVGDHFGAEEISYRMVEKFPDKYAIGWYKAPIH